MIIVAITGASGIQYAIKLLNVLKYMKRDSGHAVWPVQHILIQNHHRSKYQFNFYKECQT